MNSVKKKILTQKNMKFQKLQALKMKVMILKIKIKEILKTKKYLNMKKI